MAFESDILKALLRSLSADDRITVWHLAIIIGIVQLASDGLLRPIYISRRLVMDLARIGSIGTYHKCMKELQSFGYLRYRPSYHPGIRTEVQLNLVRIQ